MAVITISGQYGSGDDEIAAKVCEILGYRYFDKSLVCQMAAEMGLVESDIVDFSEDNYKMQGFIGRFFTWQSPYTVAQAKTWQEDITGVKVRRVINLDEAHSTSLVQNAVKAAYKHDDFVIVGRGGQAILKERPGVLHVRIGAPLSLRVQRLHARANISLAGAKDKVLKRDRTAADYLKRFHDVDWTDSMLYDLVINTGKLSIDAAAQLIVRAVSYLPITEAPGVRSMKLNR